MKFINQYRILLAYIISCLLFLSACVTTKKVKEIAEIRSLPIYNNGLNNITIKGSFSYSFKGQSQSTDCKLLLAKTDSLSLTIYGPFGMTLARLFAKPDYFLFYNAYNNEAIEGAPSKENLQKIAYLPLNYSDFIQLIRYEIIGNPSDFEIQPNFKDDKSVLFQSNKNSDYVEYYLVSKEDALIKQYQRKLRNGTLILNVFYRDVEENDSFHFPESIEFNFPTLDMGLKIDCKDLDFNENYDKPFLVNLPSNIVIKRLE
jgi:hypothetical protein